VDIGGESTRPGATRIDAAEQIRRTVPVIAAIRRELAAGPVITIDTTLAEVARAALDVGADAINDVSAGTEDPGILVLAAQRRCGLILMHRLAPPGRDVFSHQYAAPPDYSASGGVTGAVVAFLPEAIVVDPGLGFGKTVEQNLELIRGTPALCELGRPVLSGVSRKSFTAKAAGIDTVRHPRERVHASVGLSVAHLFCGATIFRVHDVREHVEALRAAWAARDQSGPAGTPTA
jgi:dihydropteroate synthase